MNKKFFLLFAVLVFNFSLLYASGASIVSMEGEVRYMTPEDFDWQRAQTGIELPSGSRIRTGAASSAELKFKAGHSASLGENTTLLIETSSEDETGVEMFNGKLRSRVRELGRDQAYTISTPQAVCAVRGTVFDVEVSRRSTVVNVVSGRVEAMELITGAKVEIGAGRYSTIVPGSAPQTPVETPEGQSIEESSLPELRNEMRENAFREMFQEISRDAVLRRAADEIKRAEYENGKALIDAAGSRVRLEEYVVRENNSAGFKYVVLNHRDERFDFGQISFMFDSFLPDDLSRVTRNMFYSSREPEWVLTDLVSVITNTRDRVNEVAQGGDMIQDSDGGWRHYFGDYTFLIKGEGKNEKELWNQKLRLASGGSLYEDLVFERSYYAGEEPFREIYMPSGENYFHARIRNTYADGTWIQAEDYLINDSGDIQKESHVSGGLDDYSLRDYLYGLNFERVYTSSEFEDRNIDLVFSTKLLMDSGMLDFKVESAGTN